MDAAKQDEIIAQFCSITGAAPSEARQLLESHNWQLEETVTLYFASQDGADMASGDVNDEASINPPAAAAQPSSSSSSSKQAARKQAPPTTGNSKLKTLKDLQGNAHDDHDSDSEERQDFFAGGEKSALAVQNPNSSSSADLYKNILNQARENRPRIDDDAEEDAGSSNFTGRAQTLGGDLAPSQLVHDPSQDEAADLPLVQRTLHLWQDGFSVDDGELYRFDDPANAAAVAHINQGRAPQSLLNVQHNQKVDLNLVPHKTDFVQPPKVYKPFGGSGQRLGGEDDDAKPAQVIAAASTTPSSSTQAQAAATPTVEIDHSQPTVSLQIRLGDGSRLATRFNTTHTIADIHRFVNASNPASTQRQYALMTTFPSKQLDDQTVTIGDIDALKKGGVVVQKWS